MKRQSEEKQEGTEKEVENQTDQEKSVFKRTAALIEVCGSDCNVQYSMLVL